MKYFLVFILNGVLLTACMCGGERVPGNGNVITQQRQVDNFDEVKVYGSMDVFVAQGDRKPVQIECDENLMDYILIEQDGDAISIKTKSGYNLRPTREIKVFLTAPSFRSIEVSGSCDITSQGQIMNKEDLALEVSGSGMINMAVDAPEITTKLAGSGEINLKGETKRLELDISGSAEAHCYELLAEEAVIDISGSGNAEIFASRRMEIDVSGSGNVTYKGGVQNISQQVRGSGSVRRVD